MASTASSGWRSSATAAGWFQWGLGEEKGWVSCAGPRWSLLGGQRGRRKAAVAVPRRRRVRAGWRVDGGAVLGCLGEELAKEWAN